MKIAVTAAALVSIAGTASAIEPATLAYTDNKVDASQFSRDISVYDNGYINNRGAVVGDPYDVEGFWQDASYAFPMISVVTTTGGPNLANTTYTFDGLAEVNPDATQLAGITGQAASLGVAETQFQVGTANNLPVNVVEAILFSADGGDMLVSGVGGIVGNITDLRVDFGNFGISGIDVAFPPGATSFSITTAIFLWGNTGLATGTATFTTLAFNATGINDFSTPFSIAQIGVVGGAAGLGTQFIGFQWVVEFVPTPASATLLGAAGLMGLRRRRH
jgi:hypothetical protein